jgi:hypothetical protein
MLQDADDLIKLGRPECRGRFQQNAVISLNHLLFHLCLAMISLGMATFPLLDSFAA